MPRLEHLFYLPAFYASMCGVSMESVLVEVHSLTISIQLDHIESTHE